MSLRQLEYFVAVAEAGSVCRAASRVFVSQPPLTRQIRALEEELNAVLFERSVRGVTLTLAGQRLLAHARSVLSLVSATRDVVQGG